MDYAVTFSEAYFSTYSEKISTLPDKNLIPFMEKISKKLEDPKKLENHQLKELSDFCVNLSDYSATHEEKVNSYRGPCFLTNNN